LALAHGIYSGSDSASAWARWIYWASGGSLLFLLIYRILVSAFRARPAAARPPNPAAARR
ncbi:MAG: hypothetical protein ACKOC5_15585, partial [Chloroflexota bacterium]